MLATSAHGLRSSALAAIEIMTASRYSTIIERMRHGEMADWLAVAVAVSLPWSTSATSILIVLWLIVVAPSLSPASVRREVATAAGGLPVLLWGLAVIGMLWAQASWSERFLGLRGFHKLLLIPLLLAHFRRSQQAKWVIAAFCMSAAVLLVLSFSLMSSPVGPWEREKYDFGVPVKDYLAQSGIFAICALGLLRQAIELWRRRRVKIMLVFVFLALAFFTNIMYVATARTTLIVILVLLLLLGFRQFGWRGMMIGGLIGCVLASLVWASSPYLRGRLTHLLDEVQDHRVDNAPTSVGLRFEYWEKSIEFIAAAPLVGHGTGTIESLFRRSAIDNAGPASLVTGNPHSQILGVAIQLGLIGMIALVAMWIAHLALFREHTLISCFGFVVVVQNIVSSLFNSHLFDFVQGWIYVFGVGMLGGAVLGRTQPKAETDVEQRNTVSISE
jgi:O-antigen ligase